MRPAVQFALAAAIVAAAAAAASAIENSATLLQNVTVTHTATIEGVGKTYSSYAIESGFCSFGSSSGYLSCELGQVKPGGTGVTGSAYVQVPKKSATNTVYRAGVSSTDKKRTREEQLQALVDQGFLVDGVVGAEGPGPMKTKPYRPIGGDVTLTSAATSLNARVYKGFTRYNVDLTTNYKGTITGGPNDGKNVKGTIRVKGRNLPRSGT